MTKTVSFGAALLIALAMAQQATAQDPAVPPAAPGSADSPAAGASPISGGPASPAAAPAQAGTPGEGATVAAAAPELPLGRVGCVAPPSGASEQQVSTFLDEPASLLSDPSMTSLEISARVRALVGADTRTLEPMVALLAEASADQRAAIGSGLGRSAFACQEVNPIYANAIQARIADVPFADVRTAFLAATNDIQVAAIAGAASAGAAGAPGLSGGGDAGPGTAGMGGDRVTPTTTPAYNIGHGGGAFIGGDRERLLVITVVSPDRI